MKCQKALQISTIILPKHVLLRNVIPPDWLITCWHDGSFQDGVFELFLVHTVAGDKLFFSGTRIAHCRTPLFWVVLCLPATRDLSWQEAAKAIFLQIFLAVHSSVRL